MLRNFEQVKTMQNQEIVTALDDEIQRLLNRRRDFQPAFDAFDADDLALYARYNQAYHDAVFMRKAFADAMGSHCVSNQVGAIAVRNGVSILSGVNGTPPGTINCDQRFKQYNPLTDREEHRAWSKLHEIHAEMNLINSSSRFGIPLAGTTVYCTHQLCSECFKNYLSLGLERVVICKGYDKAGITIDEERARANEVGMQFHTLSEILTNVAY